MPKSVDALYRNGPALVREVPEWAGGASGGETYQVALANVEVVIRKWSESAKGLSACSQRPAGLRLG
jgi:hypothetical protein